MVSEGAAARVLVVDDDCFFLALLREQLAADGLDVHVAASAREARAKLDCAPDVVIVDNQLPDARGIELLAEIQQALPYAKTMVVTGHPAFRDAVEAMRLGVVDYFTKPVEPEALRLALLRNVDTLRCERVARSQRVRDRQESSTRTFVACGAQSSALHGLARQAATSRAPMLVTGETGTGKTLFARYVHELGADPLRPFVTVNCGALPEALVESELFGSEKGAFTGAGAVRPGLFEVADGGTLVLDEIAEMPVALQPKLLSALEDRAVRRVGATRSRPVDVRVIAATNVDVHEAMRTGRLRRDLYFRLGVLEARLSPLRERRDDLPALVAHLLGALANGRCLALAGGEQERLSAYDWPGNVRELRNVLERSTIVDPAMELRPSRFVGVAGGMMDVPRARTDSQATEGFTPLDDLVREHILRALAVSNGHRRRACDLLGLSESTLRRRMHEYGLMDARKRL